VDAEGAEADVDSGIWLGWTGAAAQLREGDQGGVRVAGQIDLGNDRDVPGRRVSDDFRVFLLRVEATRTAADLGQAARLGEPRPRADLDAPSLSVGEVQMQHVDLVQGDRVDVLLHLVDREEVPGHVEHRAAPAEAWPIDDVARGNGYGS